MSVEKQLVSLWEPSTHGNDPAQANKLNQKDSYGKMDILMIFLDIKVGIHYYLCAIVKFILLINLDDSYIHYVNMWFNWW